MSLLDALNPARSAVVEACAGSGKTWLLVSRMLRLLLAGAPPSSILALTFTRKAAQEMHERLDDWLRLLALAPEEEVLDFLTQRGLDMRAAREVLPRARELYEAVLESEPGIAIDTFHGWFLRLIDLAPLAAPEAGDTVVGADGQTVNPHGAALSDAPGQLLNDAWQRLAIRLAREGAESSEAAARLHAAFETLLRELGLSGTRGALFEFAQRRAEWWAYTAEDENPARDAAERLEVLLEVDREIDHVAAFVGANIDACARYGGLLGKRSTKTDSELAQRWTAHAQLTHADAAAQAQARYQCVKGVLLTKAGTVRSRKASKAQAGEMGGPAAEQEFLDLHARLSEGLLAVEAALLDGRIAAINSAAFVCGVALLEEFAQVKGERRMIDFTDAEWLATRLLTGEEHAAYLHARLDARVRHLLLDEFQDTNPMQWAALKGWLAAYGGDAARPSILLVGDPKQSIYRFRRADARIFDAAGLWLQEQWQAVHLPMNVTRRNAGPVVDTVNALFSAEPTYARFNAQGTLMAHLPGRVELWPLAQGGEKPEAGTTLRNPLLEARIESADMQMRREKEARLIAARITQFVGHTLVGEPGKERSAHCGDVMILTRKRGALPAIEAALRAANIPFVTARQGGLLDTLEARDLYALIEFLVTPANDLALAHALKSPVFGAGDEDLIALAAMGERGISWWERLAAAQELPPALARARRLIAGWREVAGLLPVHDLLDRIYHEAQVLPRYADAMPAHLRERALSNLEAFVALALQLEAGRFPSLPRFLDDLRSARRGDLNESPDEAPTAAGEVVRLMTVHGSKGLEAPAVFLADANAGSARGSGGALIAWPPDADAPDHFSLLTGGAVGQAREPLVEAEQAADAIEELNVLYVAMTRAKQLLVITGVENKTAGEDSAYNRIARALNTLRQEEAAQSAPDEPLAWGELPQAAPGMRAARDEVESQPGDDALPEIADVPPIGARRAPPSEAMLAGIQLHAVFQAMLDETDLGRPMPNVAQVASRTGVPLLLAAELLRSARALSERKEMARFFDRASFARAVNELEIISGGEFKRADRVVEFDDEVWVLDYKARVTPEELPGYRAQIGEYREALRAIHAGREVRAALIDLSEGLLIEV